MEGNSIPIPRGGPIYVPNLVAPLSSVPNFESSLLLQLQVYPSHSLCLQNYPYFTIIIKISFFCFGSQNLNTELSTSDSSLSCDEDIS